MSRWDLLDSDNKRFQREYQKPVPDVDTMRTLLQSYRPSQGRKGRQDRLRTYYKNGEGRHAISPRDIDEALFHLLDAKKLEDEKHEGNSLT